MEYLKVYYFVEVVSKDKNGKDRYEYYGKNKKCISVNDDNAAWYVKEYGFNTAAEAYTELRKISRWYDKNGFKYSGMQIRDTKVKFPSYQEYLRVKAG